MNGLMIHSALKKLAGKLGKVFTKMGEHSSPHYSETLVLMQPDFTLKDAKKAGLLPQHTREQ
jgi:hypothetical protein